MQQERPRQRLIRYLRQPVAGCWIRRPRSPAEQLNISFVGTEARPAWPTNAGMCELIVRPGCSHRPQAPENCRRRLARLPVGRLIVELITAECCFGAQQAANRRRALLINCRERSFHLPPPAASRMVRAMIAWNSGIL